MTRIARFTPRAGRDIDDIAERIAIDNLDSAIRFCVAVRSDAQRLAEMPGLGALYGLRDPAFAEVRFWTIGGFRNYLLFYSPINDGIEVMRVLHGARDIERVFGQT